MQTPFPLDAHRLRVVAAALAAGALAFLLRGLIASVLALVAGGAAVAFLAHPLARVLEKKLSRPTAALASLLALGAVLALGLGFLVPALARELATLAEVLPRSLSALGAWTARASSALSRLLPGITLPELRPEAILGGLPNLASGTVTLAANAADVFGRLSIMVILGYFFLCDRESLGLRLELMLPQSVRGLAVRMANAVGRDLRLYLRAQLWIALSVAALAAGMLALLGVRSALVLGILIGLFNMIPYFGPFIGGAPAVLIALGDGLQKALLTLAALCLVQQLDGSVISPRIMGSVTGLSPALVLVALFAAARLAGVWGMLFALPVMIVFRTLFRVYVQRRENI